MLIINSKNSKNNKQKSFEISEEYLKYVIKNIAIPRHYVYEKANNDKVRDWIVEEFEQLGLVTTFQGSYDNIVATSKGFDDSLPITIIGGHYDSVPKSLGADDNASAIAGVLATAKVLQEKEVKSNVMFVAFNREEDGLLGSEEFVASLSEEIKKKIIVVHILEMIGFCSHEPKSQFVPEGLPIKVSSVGDFIAIIANKSSNQFIKPIMRLSEQEIDNLPVTGLKVFLGVEKFFPHLSRSDHAPFWKSGLPALMWTDTSEFRNPNYHKASDTPESLDYAFMRKVIELLVFSVLEKR